LTSVKKMPPRLRLYLFWVICLSSG
jgi:hypothetical protein